MFVFEEFLADSKLLYPTWLEHENIVQCRHVPKYHREKVWQINWEYQKDIRINIIKE
jgi:hypothetical protein